MRNRKAEKMIIGIASTGRSLDENVYKRFANSPAYLIYDTSDKSVRSITNFAKYNDGCGPQAAKMLVDNKIDTAIIGDIDEKSLEILKTGNIDIYYGYPGMCKEALQKLDENKIRKTNDVKPILDLDKNTHKNEIKNFTFVNLSLTFTKESTLFEDWSMILHHPTAERVPTNWILPYNFSEGIYYLKLEVLEMNKTRNPIEFEFGWRNFPEEKHPNIPHRCSFGIYSSITSPGVYEHIARIKDMENTSVDGKEEAWSWKSSWDCPFSLIKPYRQEPYPIKLKYTVNIYSG